MPRTKQFDEAEVLEKAMELFWKQGYHGTSIQNLVDHLGINRASLYDTFGGKDALFKKALESYRDQNFQQISAFLESQPSIREGIRQLFLASVVQSAVDPERKGCFMVNTTTELVPNDPSLLPVLIDNQRAFETLFTYLLQKGVEQGEIDSSKDLSGIASFLFTLYNGLKVVAKITPDQDRLEASVRAGLSVLD